MAKIKIMQFKLNMYFVKHDDTWLKIHTILILLHFYCWFSRGREYIYIESPPLFNLTFNGSQLKISSSLQSLAPKNNIWPSTSPGENQRWEKTS